MKKTLVTVALAVVTLSAGSALAQFNNATANANASARVIAAITLSSPIGLNFGDVVAGASLGTVSVDFGGARTAGGGTTLGSGTGVSAAVFNVSGFGGATYVIQLPSSPIALGTMTVDTFIGSKGLASTLTAGGTDSFTVGATLHVAASQAPGSYSGTFPVTVTYN
jgi:hypothetical protein